MGIRNFINKLFGNEEQTPKNTEEKLKETMQETGQSIEETGTQWNEKVKPILNNMSNSAEDLGRKIMDEGKDAAQKAGQIAEKTGAKIIETSDKVWNEVFEKAEQIKESETVKKAADFTEKVGGKVIDEADKAWEKLKEKAESISEKLNETMDKPREDPFKKYENSHNESAHLDALKKDSAFGSGSFFDKAASFADGDYDAVKPDAEPKITNVNEQTENQKDPWQGEIHGFTDADGDGDPLIDDAQIEEEKP
jgi:ElaB/YqjD/DUF883 family membrane-anchored ribosome-binding protein